MTFRTPIEEALNERRRHLRLNWRALGAKAGVSHETLRRLRTGDPVSDVTEAGVEQALNWSPGSIAAIRNGQQAKASGEGPIGPGDVVVPIEDVVRVLHGPMGNADAYIASVNRLHDACMDAAEAAGPVANEDDDTSHEDMEVPF